MPNPAWPAQARRPDTEVTTRSIARLPAPLPTRTLARKRSSEAGIWISSPAIEPICTKRSGPVSSASLRGDSRISCAGAPQEIVQYSIHAVCKDLFERGSLFGLTARQRDDPIGTKSERRHQVGGGEGPSPLRVCHRHLRQPLRVLHLLCWQPATRQSSEQLAAKTSLRSALLSRVGFRSRAIPYVYGTAPTRNAASPER